MPERSNWPARAKAVGGALAAVLLTGAGPARAQLLDLKPGAGSPGVAGEGTAALIDHLHAEASRLRDERGKASALAGGALDAHKQRAFELRIAARERARALLTLASSRGDAGSAHALAALTLIARFDALDAWADQVEQETSPTPAGDAAMAFMLAEVDDGGANIGTTAALDRWLARALGPRAQALGPAPAATWDAVRLHAGWVPDAERCDDPASLSDLAARWSAAGRGDRPASRDRRLSDDAAAALRSLDEGVTGAIDWWADAPGAARVDGLVRTAGRVMDGLEPPPPREATDALAARFDGACKALATDPERALAELERLAAIVAIIDDTARAIANAPRGVTPSTKDLVWKSVWAAQLGTGPDDHSRRDALRRSIDTLLRAAVEPSESTLLREARPMLRRLNSEMELAKRELWTSIARPTARNPMDDPGIVGSLATVRRLDAARRALVTIGPLLEAPKSPSRVRGDPGLIKARARLISLAKDLERTVSRDTALSALLVLLDAGEAFIPTDAERLIRASPTDAAWTGASDAKATELLAALDAARTAVLRSWGEATPDAAAMAARVASLARLVELVHAGTIGVQIARQASAERAGVISRHPGVELSGPAAAALLPDLETDVARLVGLALAEATRDVALKEVDRLYDASAGVRLFARLETAARAMDLVNVDVAIELSPAPGPRPWLGDRREDLALLCWHAHELAAAQLRRDREAAAARTGQINALASRVLETLDR